MRARQRVRVGLFVLLMPPVATVGTCALAFGILFLLGNRYSLEQVLAAAIVQVFLWYVVLSVWAVRVWRRTT